MLAIATVNLSGLPVDSIVEVDPDDDRIAGLLTAGYLRPITHKAMAAEDRPPVIIPLDENAVPVTEPAADAPPPKK